MQSSNHMLEWQQKRDSPMVDSRPSSKSSCTYRKTKDDLPTADSLVGGHQLERPFQWMPINIPEEDELDRDGSGLCSHSVQCRLLAKPR